MYFFTVSQQTTDIL